MASASGAHPDGDCGHRDRRGVGFCGASRQRLRARSLRARPCYREWWRGSPDRGGRPTRLRRGPLPAYRSPARNRCSKPRNQDACPDRQGHDQPSRARRAPRRRADTDIAASPGARWRGAGIVRSTFSVPLVCRAGRAPCWGQHMAGRRWPRGALRDRRDAAGGGRTGTRLDRHCRRTGSLRPARQDRSD